MTHEENIKTVREACVRANPTLACNRCTCCREKWELRKSGVCPLCERGKIAPFTEDPTALDVLLALGELKGSCFAVTDGGTIISWASDETIGFCWDVCRLDLRATLSSWDEATVAALADLLKNNG